MTLNLVIPVVIDPDPYQWTRQPAAQESTSSAIHQDDIAPQDHAIVAHRPTLTHRTHIKTG